MICYFSGGTLEDFRSDYDQFIAVKNLVKTTYGDWPDEKWIDIRMEELKPLILNRMKLAVSKKCDAIEVDNLDGYQMDEVKSWSNPLTKEDTIKYAIWLGNSAHELGISIGLKNVLGIINEVGNYFDFAINEECIDYNECYLYKDFIKSGKAVFGVTYNGLEKNKNALCRNLDGLGMSMNIKPGIELVQGGILFNGKEHCGSNFNVNFDGKQNNATTLEKTTTLIVKVTTTKKSTTVSKKTTKTTVTKTTTPIKATTKKSTTTSTTNYSKTKQTTISKKTTTTKKPITSTKKTTTSKKSTTKTTKKTITTEKSKSSTKKLSSVIKVTKKVIKVVSKVVTKKN